MPWKVGFWTPAMLPATLQFFVAMIASAMTDRLTQKVAYMHEEVRVLGKLLEAATGKKRIAFTAEQRRRLALKGKDLTAKERAACCQIVRPETLSAWHRNLGARNYDSSKTLKAGRPRKPDEIRALVLRLATENPRWGYTKIRDALRGLKIEIGRTTVANILAGEGMDPAPLAYDGAVLGGVLRIFTETVAAWYRKRAAKQCGTANSECGGLTVIQRASSDLRLNPHFHTLFLDGVCVRDDADENAPSVFHAAPPPTQEAVQAVVRQAAKRIVRFLQKRGLIALGTALGDGQVTVVVGDAPKPKGRLCAEQWGFNLHAATRVHGNDKQGREHLCRYILRPPFANHRLQTLPDSKVQLGFKRPELYA